MPSDSSYMLDVPAQDVYISGSLVSPTVRQWEFVGLSASYNTSTQRMVLTVLDSGEWKDSVYLATDAAIAAHAFGSGVITFNANGNQSVDGVATTLGSRILVKDEAATHLEHGIYEVTTQGNGSTQEVWTRTSDADEDSEVVPQMRVAVQAGTANTGTTWVLSTPASGTITVNTTAIAFTERSEGDQITVNSAACTNVDLDDSTPAAISGTNVLWQSSGTGPTSVSAYVPAASTTVVGAIELATQGELDAGIDSTRAVTSNIIAAAAHLIHDNVAGEFSANPANKATPVGGDFVLIEDSADSNSKKYTTLTQLGTAMSWVGGGDVTATGGVFSTDQSLIRVDGAASKNVSDTGANATCTDAGAMSLAASLSIGASPAASGALRLANAAAIKYPDSVSGDNRLIGTDEGSDTVTVGDANGSNVNFRAGSGALTRWYHGGSQYMTLSSSGLDCALSVYVNGGGGSHGLHMDEVSSSPATGGSVGCIFTADDGTTTQLKYRTESSGAEVWITPSAAATPAGGDLVWFVDVDDSNKRKSCTFTNLGTAMSWTGGGGISGSGTENHIAKWAAGGADIQDSGVIIDASDNITGVTKLSVDAGGSVSTTGDINGPDAFKLYAYTDQGTNEQPIITKSTSDTVVYGDDTLTSSIAFKNKTGSSYTFSIAATPYVTITSSLTTLATPLAVGGASGTAGNINVPNDTTCLSADKAGGGTIALVSTDASNNEIIGGTVANVFYRAATAHAFDAPSGSGRLVITDSLVTTYLPIAVNSGTVASTGDIRLADAGTIYAWGTGPVDVHMLGKDASDIIRVGDATNADGMYLQTSNWVSLRSGAVDALVAYGTKVTTSVPIEVNAGTAAATGDVRLTATGSIRMYKATTDITALDCSALYDVRLATGGSGVNIGLFGSPTTYDSMVGGVYLKDRTTAPSGDPNGGGYLYSEGGASMWRGSSGTTTILAAA